MKRAPTLVARIILALATAVPAELFAQSDLSFKVAGSVDAQGAYSPANDSSVFRGPAPAREMSAGALIDGKISFSRRYTTLGLLDYTFDQSSLLDHSSGASFESLGFTVNELYADLNYGDLFFLRLGKQRLKWGAGYVFNPSDPVNPPKNPTALRAVREGVPAVKAEIITKPLSIAAFAVLFDAIDQTGMGAKLSTSLLPGSDISLSGYYSASESWTAALNASVAPLYSLPGWDTLLLWFEGGLYGRGRYGSFAPGPVAGAVTVGPSADGSSSFLVGASGQLPLLRTMLLSEYYHLSEGLTRDQSAAVYRALSASNPAVVGASAGWLSELARRPARSATDYLFVSLTQPSITDDGNPLLDKIGLLGSCLFNLVDGSFLATGGLVTTFIKDSEVDLTLNWAQGDRLSEFGNALSPLSATLDVKVFF